MGPSPRTVTASAALAALLVGTAPRALAMPFGGPGAPVSPTVAAALESAGQATGTSTAVLSAIAWKESRFDPAARNRRSSACGLMQFTRASWLAAVRDYGPALGLGRLAAQLRTGRGGAISARDGRALAEVLRLRDDPRIAALLAGETIARERTALERAIGRTAAPADLYFVHLLGPAGARGFLAELRRAPSRSSLAVVGARRARPNGSLFMGRGGRARTLAEVYAEVERLFAPSPSA